MCMCTFVSNIDTRWVRLRHTVTVGLKHIFVFLILWTLRLHFTCTFLDTNDELVIIVYCYLLNG